MENREKLWEVFDTPEIEYSAKTIEKPINDEELTRRGIEQIKMLMSNNPRFKVK